MCAAKFARKSVLRVLYSREKRKRTADKYVQSQCAYHIYMNRKETTEFLTNLLIATRLSDRKYYAREVTLDYGTVHPKRIDVMEFSPAGVIYASDIEKGIFTCYEVKSCKQDVYSGNGLNFYGEKNYIVTTMETYKAIQDDLRDGKLNKHIMDFMCVPECPEFGIIVAVPASIDLRNTKEAYKEYENPTPLESGVDWKLWNICPQQRQWHRDRSMSELLFCMLRAKHNGANQ